jgi:hypothetical protein
MDFIERIFGVSPDGGAGTLEVVLVLAPLFAVWLLRARRRGSRDDLR